MSAHCAIVGTKYTIKAHDSVFGAKSQDFTDEILKQIPGNSKKTRQLYLKPSNRRKKRGNSEYKNTRWCEKRYRECFQGYIISSTT